MEPVLYTLLGIGIAMAAGALVWLGLRFLDSRVKDILAEELTAFRLDMIERQIKFFEDRKSDATRNESNIIDFKSENVQNDSGSNETPEPPLWNNKDRLRNLRDQLQAGEFSDYTSEPQLSDLMPLDALRKVDSALMRLEEMET